MLGFQSTVPMTEAEYRKELGGHPVRNLVLDLVSLLRHPKVDSRIESTSLLRIPYHAIRSLIPHRTREDLKLNSEPASSSNRSPNARPKRKWLPSKESFRWMASKTRVRIDKAPSSRLRPPV